MAIYEVTTEQGTYQVETEEQAKQQPTQEQPKQGVMQQLLGMAANPMQTMASGLATGLDVGQNRIPAALRSGAMGQGMAQGFQNPEQVPSFTNAYLQQNPVQNIADVAKLPMIFGANIADELTNPINLAMDMAGIYGAMKLTGRAIETTEKTGQFVRTIWNRGRPDYIQQDLSPKVIALFKNKILGFSPEIETYARDTLKIPESAIQTLKTKGIARVATEAENLGNNADVISQRIAQGLENKKAIADTAYKQAMAGVNESTPLQANEFYGKIKGILKRFRMIDEKGNPLSRAETAPTVYKQMVNVQQDLKAHIVGPGRSLPTGTLRKADFELYRDQLKAMLKDTPSDRNVMELRNALYNDAEKSGIKGIKAARDLEKEAFEASEKFPQSLYSESKLTRFHEKSFSQEDLRKLKDLEKYIGKPFINDLDSLTASQYLGKITEGKDINNFNSLLERAIDPKNTKTVQRELAQLIGDKNSQEVIQEVINHRRAREFIGRGTARTIGKLLRGI